MIEAKAEFEKWAVNKYGVRIKETDIKWWEERQEIWNACHAIMADRVKELEEQNINNSNLAMFHAKEVSTLKSKLDEAVEIIKTISKNANHYDKIDLQNKAEQFLSSLDKTKEEK